MTGNSHSMTVVPRWDAPKTLVLEIVEDGGHLSDDALAR